MKKIDRIVAEIKDPDRARVKAALHEMFQEGHLKAMLHASESMKEQFEHLRGRIERAGNAKEKAAVLNDFLQVFNQLEGDVSEHYIKYLTAMTEYSKHKLGSELVNVLQESGKTEDGKEWTGMEFLSQMMAPMQRAGKYPLLAKVLYTDIHKRVGITGPDWDENPIYSPIKAQLDKNYQGVSANLVAVNGSLDPIIIGKEWLLINSKFLGSKIDLKSFVKTVNLQAEQQSKVLDDAMDRFSKLVESGQKKGLTAAFNKKATPEQIQAARAEVSTAKELKDSASIKIKSALLEIKDKEVLLAGLEKERESALPDRRVAIELEIESLNQEVNEIVNNLNEIIKL